MGEFLITSSDPLIQRTYAKALQNPSEYIGIVDKTGYKDYDYYPNGFLYLVFPEARKDQNQESEPWSFAILVSDQDDPSQTFASVQVQLNRDGEVYTGSTDFLPGYYQISRYDLSLASDTLFNIPDEMKALPLVFVPSETPLEFPTLERTYEGYLQVATVMGRVMLIAPHPFPHTENVGESTTPKPYPYPISL